MNTLIFNGSPRKNGNTVSLINAFTDRLKGSYRIADAYYSDISACVDCRYCQKHFECHIKDGMQEIYDYIKSCDNIIIASPIYFSELTPPLLSIGSRLQTFYCSRTFGGGEPFAVKKRGGIVLVGGGDGGFNTAEKTAGILLKQMGVGTVYPTILSINTDTVPSAFDNNALRQMEALADLFDREL